MRRSIRALGLTCALIVTAAVPAGAYLTDTEIHPPPTTGAYAYYSTFGTFGPDRAEFPGAGASYVDPVFGSTVRRLTSSVGIPSGSDIYAKNGFWNADSTLILHNTLETRTILDATTGAVIRSGVPGDSEGSFAPDDPDTWYWWSGASLMKYSVASGGSSVVKTFAASLRPLGGSVDWIDNSGRYMVLNIGGSVRVWDRQADVLYAGALSSSVGSGWIGISPDGRYVVTAGDPTVHLSYAIDHATRTVNTTGVSFWTLCGDHGDLMSASDGKTYFITHECDNDPGIWAVDVTVPQTAADKAKQRADARKLLALPWADNDGHISAVSRGAFADWAFVSVESGDDTFTAGVSGWRVYKQEIVMVNVVTGEVRRLAHHRSRGLAAGSYYYQPRVNASWDGTRVAWASNMGYEGVDYGDIYSIALEASAPPPPPPPPGGSLLVAFVNPASGATVGGVTPVEVSAGEGSGNTYTLSVDGATVYAGPSATFAWDTTTVANGAHTLAVQVTATDGATGTATRAVTVANTPLIASFTAPVSGATVAGTRTVGMAASGATPGPLVFTFAVDDDVLAIQTQVGAAATYAWKTTSALNGPHVLSVTVQDAAGRTAVATEMVTVANVTSTTVTAAMTSPKAGAVVKGTITVQMSMSGGAGGACGLNRFALSVDGVLMSAQSLDGTAASYAWNTKSVANGSHVLTLVVTDATGKSATLTRTVTVTNP